MKLFKIETKLGPIHFRINGANEAYVDTTKPRSEDYREPEQRIAVTIRGKRHLGNVRFGLNPRTGLWDGRTYGFDGNTIVFVSDQQNEYFKQRAVWLYQEGGSDATDAAKIKFYDEVLAALQSFYSTHKAEIDAERYARRVEYHRSKIEKATTALAEAKAKVQEAEDELDVARQELERAEAEGRA